MRTISNEIWPDNPAVTPLIKRKLLRENQKSSLCIERTLSECLTIKKQTEDSIKEIKEYNLKIGYQAGLNLVMSHFVSFIEQYSILQHNKMGLLCDKITTSINEYLQDAVISERIINKLVDNFAKSDDIFLFLPIKTPLPSNISPDKCRHCDIKHIVIQSGNKVIKFPDEKLYNDLMVNTDHYLSELDENNKNIIINHFDEILQKIKNFI